MMSIPVSPEEQEQLLQTIEMFEVIAQSNPRDCQSLEILKEAYWKIGRQQEAIVATRNLADAYISLGQYASAMLEYEGILQHEPDNSEIVALLGEVESKLHLAETAQNSRLMEETIDVDFGELYSEDPSLITTHETRRPDGESNLDPIDLQTDGNDPLSAFLIKHRIVPEELVKTALERVRHMNRNLTGEAIAVSLIDEIARSPGIEVDPILCGILDRTKFAFIPLDIYDVDRQIVKMLPEALTLGRLLVPFDIISRTVMVAMANPFDALGKQAAQQMLDYNIQWHLATPAAITKTLRDSYRLTSAVD